MKTVSAGNQNCSCGGIILLKSSAESMSKHPICLPMIKPNPKSSGQRRCSVALGFAILSMAALDARAVVYDVTFSGEITSVFDNTTALVLSGTGIAGGTSHF